MNEKRPILLGVNIDHVATIRQARGTAYPDPVDAVRIVTDAGADGITMHLREDRRHIQDRDVINVKREATLPLNLEMAATAEMLTIAMNIEPRECCLVPEKREELTTEGGLDVAAQVPYLRDYCARLRDAGIAVSMFIDPSAEQIEASAEINAPIIELHTGGYAGAATAREREDELGRIEQACDLGLRCGLQVNAGHGLHYTNVQAVAGIGAIECLNIGHAIVARAVFDGLAAAVREMKRLMDDARGGG